MKILIPIVTMVVVVFGIVSCAHTVQKQPNAQERPIKIASTLLLENYALFGVRSMEMPIAEHSSILAKDETTEVKIQVAQDFAQVVRELTSPEDALEFVRLLTSEEIRPFLRDIYYSEVHKKMEPKTEDDEEDRWFAIEAEQYEAWKLHEPVVTEEDSTYKIERFVASYPQVKGQELTPAQLLKIWEWVDFHGKYSMEIQEVIAEGDIIQKILLFTK